MMRRHHSVFVVLSAMAALVAGQDFNTVTECARPCFGEMKLKAVELGCANDADMACLCTKQSFKDGLRSCSEPKCTDFPGALDTLFSYTNAVCAAAGAPLVTSASATPTPTATPTPPPPPPSSSPEPVPSSSVPTTASAASTASTTPSASAANSTSPTASQSSSLSPSSSTSTSAPSSAPSSAADVVSDSTASPQGLSQATKLGIGIGGGAAALGVIAVAVCVVLHKRGSRRNSGIRSLTISDPMPGSGRSYAGDHHTEKYSPGMSDLEFKSRRYEDMLPRQSPRTMV